jgi:DNA-binding NarL/FixJ family response regulator
MDGLAFLAAARRLRPGIPCLLMTARTSPRAEEAVERGEVLACVPKTGDPGALAAEVIRALAGEGG